VKSRRMSWRDLVVVFSALALLLTMSFSWFGTEISQQARDMQQQAVSPGGAVAAQFDADIRERAQAVIDREDKNVWQADTALDRFDLAVLSLCVVGGIGSAFVRTMSDNAGLRAGVSIACASVAILGSILIVYQIVARSSLFPGATLRPATYLGLVFCGILTLGAALGLRGDDSTGNPEPTEPTASLTV
jgi:hypothetical protein